MSKIVKKIMSTKVAIIFTLIEKNGLKFVKTFLNGMETFCEKLKSIAIVGSQI